MREEFDAAQRQAQEQSDRDHFGPDSAFAAWATKLLAYAVGGLLLIAIVLGALVLNLRGEVLTSRTRNNEGRAVLCTMVIGQGMKLPAACLRPEVTKFYDPEVKPTSATSAQAIQNREVTCAISDALRVSPRPKVCEAFPTARVGP